jgi:hypothetical protein
MSSSTNSSSLEQWLQRGQPGGFGALSKGEYTSTYSTIVPFGCSGLALCGVKVKQLLLVGQVIITSRELGFSISPSC